MDVAQGGSVELTKIVNSVYVGALYMPGPEPAAALVLPMLPAAGAKSRLRLRPALLWLIPRLRRCRSAGTQRSASVCWRSCTSSSSLWTTSTRYAATCCSGRATLSGTSWTSSTRTWRAPQAHCTSIIYSANVACFQRRLPKPAAYYRAGGGTFCNTAGFTPAAFGANRYIHNLTSTLETAVRATNAQYDDPDTLRYGTGCWRCVVRCILLVFILLVWGREKEGGREGGRRGRRLDKVSG